MAPLDGGVAFHVSCHSRAQNIGQKGAELLALIPEADVAVVERCSGHGGAWGYKKGNFETAMKVGKPAARQLQNADKKHVVSECPLAGLHIEREIETLGGERRGWNVRPSDRADGSLWTYRRVRLFPHPEAAKLASRDEEKFMRSRLARRRIPGCSSA
jgi:Fe-S oxidoreductase